MTKASSRPANSNRNFVSIFFPPILAAFRWIDAASSDDSDGQGIGGAISRSIRSNQFWRYFLERRPFPPPQFAIKCIKVALTVKGALRAPAHFSGEKKWHRNAGAWSV